jgi:uncharacterized protein (DUF58 family)
MTRTGWAVLVGGVVLYASGVVLGFVAFLAVAVAAFVSLAVAAIWVAIRPDLAVSTELSPDRIERGGHAIAVVTVTNAGTRRTIPTLIEHPVTGPGVTHIQPVVVTRLRSRHGATAPHVLPTQRRGIYQVGPSRIVRADPLGLMRWTKQLEDPLTFIVHPTVHRLIARSPGLTRELEGATLPNAPQGMMSFHSLRDYVRGDELRLIHWRSVAKHHRLIVRQNIDTTIPRMTVMCDQRAEAYQGSAAFEFAVEVCATLCQAMVDHEFPLRLVSSDGHAVGGNRNASLPTFLDFLAGVSQTSGDMDRLTEAFGRESEGATLFIVTGGVGTAQLAPLQSVASRFRRVLVIRCGGDPMPPVALGRAGVVDASGPEQLAAAWRYAATRLVDR